MVAFEVQGVMRFVDILTGQPLDATLTQPFSVPPSGLLF